MICKDTFLFLIISITLSVLQIQKTISVQVQTLLLGKHGVYFVQQCIVCFHRWHFVLYWEMSLVRMNRPLYGAGKRPVRNKKVSAPKKEWVVRTLHVPNYIFKSFFFGSGAL